jgi:LPXTG-motif cell wall-anchored protein
VSLRVLGVIGLIVVVGAVGLPLKRASALRQSQAVFSVKCNITHSAADDPIVFPRQPGRSHLHDFFGNASVDAATTTGSLVDAASSCLKGMGEVDKAGYWTPALLNGGRAVRGSADDHRIDAYYSVLGKSVPVRPFPFGLRMVAGDAKSTRPQSVGITSYDCLRYPNGGSVTGRRAAIPTCPRGSYLSAKVMFPSCWDGRNLDSADHKAHMAYPTRERCPVSHPVSLPTLSMRVRWKEARGVAGSRLSLSSGGQFSMHADFWNAWSPSVQQWLVANCLNATRNCTNISRSQVAAATGLFPSGDGQPSGSRGGAGTASQPAATHAASSATARRRDQVAQANDAAAADVGATRQPGDGGTLAATGPSNTHIPLGAGLLLAVGIAFLVVARHRPRHARR